MSKPVYTVQVDSRFRDLEKYPNTTDFGVSFRKRTSTTPFVEGLPVNSENSEFGGVEVTNFNLPVSIDPDFDNDLFQIVNGKITNMKAIDANNVVLCGIFTGNELSFYQKDLTNDNISPSYLIVSLLNNNNSTFLVKFSRVENAWTFNWAILSKQPDDYIAIDDHEINCSFDIDTNNSNISFMFNFSSPKIYIQSLTSLSVQNDNQYFTIYEANHPDNLTKSDTYPYALNNCLIYSLFDYNGNVKYIDNHPWGYNIISSNHNLIPSEINCKFNIKLDNSLAQVVSANTNNYEAVLALTGYGTGFTTSIFPNDKAYGITYTYTGLNYVVNLISDPTTNETNIITQQYTGGILTQTKFQCLTGLTTSGLTGNNFVNVCHLEKNNKIYFHLSPFNTSLSNILLSPGTYQSYIYTYDIPSQHTSYTTTGAGNFFGSRLGLPGGEIFDSTSIDPSNLTGAYIIAPNTSVYGTTNSKVEVYYWNETVTPPSLINSFDFSPARKTIIFGTPPFDLFGINYYSSIQQEGMDVYYVCSPAPLSTGTMTGDGLLFDNITSIYKINSVSITGTQILNTFETQSYFFPQLYVQNSDLNLISAAPDSQILNINKTTLEITEKSKFNGGGFGIFIKEYNNNLYAIYNGYFTNKVFQINDPANPLLISGKQQFPVFGKYEIGKILFIDDNGWCYGFSINQNTDTASFFSCPFLTQPAEIKSSHYSQNISSVLNPINYYGQNVSTYSIDYYNEPAESIVTNSFGFNPLTQLVNSSGASILYAWYDASKTGSIIVSNTGIDNYIVQVNDLSYNNRNLTPQTGGITPGDLIYKYGYSINFNGGQQLEYTGGFNSNNTGVYIAIAYKNNTGSASGYNIAGFYDYSSNTDKFNIKSFYDGTNSNTQNFASTGVESFTFSSSVVNQPLLNLADFLYYNTGSNSVYDISFRGTPTQFIDSEFNISFTGAYFKLGDNLVDFKAEIFEVIVTSSLPSVSQRQKIISYLGKKWNMNNNVPENNPYKQYSSETLYSTLLTKGSTGTSSVDIYNISNLQNIVKVYSQETTITEPTYIKVHILKDLNNTFPVSKWFLVLGKSSLEIYTDFLSNENNSFYPFYLWNRVDFQSQFSNEAWKVIPYTVYSGNGQFAILYFLVLFKNGYVKKYRMSILTPYNLEELVTEQFMLPPNGYLTSGEINIYEDGKIYFFGTVGITDVNLIQLASQSYEGKLYFADITNPYDFIKIESNINFALSNVALTNRNSTKVIKHPNGNTYLYLRSIFIDSTQFINISDYTLFTYNNYNNIEIVNSNSFSYQTPINISTQISYEDGNFGCFCPADIYINPSNNDVISIQTQNNNLTNDYFTPQDQQFYLGFTNCNFITNDPEGVLPIYPFGTRVTQLKAGSLGNKVYAGMLLSDITNSFAATGVYFFDISNPEFSYTFYQNQTGDFPLPLTTTYNDREGISIGFINKCDYEGKSEWLNSIGGSYSGIFSQFSNISNMTLDHEKRYIYLCGGWNSKVECFDSNNEISNRIVSEGTSYNGFCTKIDIIDGSFKWLTPIIGNNDDFTEKIAFNTVKDDVSFLMNFSSNNLFLYEPQYSFTGSSGTYSNPKVIKTVLFNTSSLTSSIITLDTEGNYKWKVILYTNEDAKTINSKDIYIDDETINIVGTNNTSIMRCTQSDNTDVQLLYNQTTNTSLFIYRFDLDGKYIQSNLIKYPHGINLFINDIKTFKSINQVVIFPYIEIKDFTETQKNTSIYKYNKDGSLATENGIYKLLYVDANSLLYTNTGSKWNEDPDSNNNSEDLPLLIKDFRNEVILRFQQFNDKLYIARRDYSIDYDISNAQLYAYSGNTNYLVNSIQGPNDIPEVPIIPVEVNVMENIDDKLYIGGNMSKIVDINYTEYDVNYVYYIDNTDTINQLNSGLNGFVYSIKKHFGDIYIGGNFTGDYDNLVPSNNIIRFDGTDWYSLDNGLNGVVRTLESDGINLFAGGDFTGSNSTLLNHVARWDGSTWNPMATGLNGRVNSLFYKNGSLYAGGEFTGTNLGTTGTVLNYIARWDGTGWNDMNYGLSNSVNVICDYSGNDIAIGGDFTSSFTGLNLNYSTVWNGTGWNNISSTGLTNPVTCMIYTGSTLYTFQTNPITTDNKYTQINFYKYNSSYVDLNGKTYSNLVMSYSDFEKYYQSPNAPSGTNDLTNFNAYIQGPSVSDTSDPINNDFYTKLVNTKQTIIVPNDVLNRNYSIRGNFFTGNSNFFSGLTNDTFNIVLNSEVDIKKIDRKNLPFAYYVNGVDKWASVITKSPVGDVISYEQTGPIQYIQDGILPITVTNIYGKPLNTYANLSQTQTPYYLYYYDISSTGSIGYTLVNSVIYNSSQKIYYMTLELNNYTGLPNSLPYLWLSKKNLSAEYTLQFYPATLNSSKVFNLSLNNLIIPNRPIRNTTLEGTRLLTDLPYIYLSVFNADDNGLWYGQTGASFGRQEINNFFSNNVTRDANAIFEIPMKYAVEQENFIVLSSSTKPRIKFTPNYYNIRYIITDPDGNVLLFDNTPYKSIDNFTVVPDSLLQTNISVNFEPLTN